MLVYRLGIQGVHNDRIRHGHAIFFKYVKGKAISINHNNYLIIFEESFTIALIRTYGKFERSQGGDNRKRSLLLKRVLTREYRQHFDHRKSHQNQSI